LLAAIKKSTKVEGKLAELISENTHVHKTQNRNSEKKQNQLVMELEQEINRLTVLVTEKEGVVGGLREECQGLRVQNQNLVLQNQNLQLQCKSLQT
jgi:predicted RNase H-like nuclease (RuvC/YqgF family)